MWAVRKDISKDIPKIHGVFYGEGWLLVTVTWAVEFTHVIRVVIIRHCGTFAGGLSGSTKTVGQPFLNAVQGGSFIMSP